MFAVLKIQLGFIWRRQAHLSSMHLRSLEGNGRSQFMVKMSLSFGRSCQGSVGCLKGTACRCRAGSTTRSCGC